MGSGRFHHSAPWRDPWRHDWDFCEQVVPGNKSYCKRSPRLATCESISRAAGPRRLECKFAAITRMDKALLFPSSFASFLVRKRRRRLAVSRAAGPIVYALLKGCVTDFFFFFFFYEELRNFSAKQVRANVKDIDTIDEIIDTIMYIIYCELLLLISTDIGNVRSSLFRSSFRLSDSLFAFEYFYSITLPRIEMKFETRNRCKRWW